MGSQSDPSDRDLTPSRQSPQFSFEVNADETLTNTFSPHRTHLSSPTGTTSSYSRSRISLNSPTSARASSPAFEIGTGTPALSPSSIAIVSSPTRRITNSIPPSSDGFNNQRPSQQPISSASRIETLSLENEELRNLLVRKDRYIKSLQEELTDLKEKLIAKTETGPAPIIVSSDVEGELTIDNQDSVELPPRSADRLKHSIPGSVPPPPEDQSINGLCIDDGGNIKDDHQKSSISDDHNDGLQESGYDFETRHNEPNYYEEEDKDGIDHTLKPPSDAPSISTPLSSNSNIDWNAAVQALSMSPERVSIHTPEADGLTTQFPNSDQKTPRSQALPKIDDSKDGKNTNPSPATPAATVVPGEIVSGLASTSLLPPPVPARRPELPQRTPSSNTIDNKEVPQLLSKDTVFQTPQSTQPRSPEKYPNSAYSNSPATQASSSEHSSFLPIKDHDFPLLIDPNQLHTIEPQIISTLSPPSKSAPSKRKATDPEFEIVIGLFDRLSNKEIWRIKKSLYKINNLNDEISRILLNTEFGIGELLLVPGRSNFLTNTPQKVDARRIELESYFRTLFSLPMTGQITSGKIVQIQQILARFISGDIVNLVDESNLDVLKHGWLLMKRLKGLKYTWKVKYCELDIDDGVFKFENTAGSGFDLISLQNAQIGRQQDSTNANNGENDDKAYRHAFIIMEAKKKGNGFTKHIFCAETNTERDIWVNFLIQVVDECSGNDQSTIGSSSLVDSADVATLDDNIISIQYDDSLKSPTRSTKNQPMNLKSMKEVNEEKELKRVKKRSFFPFSKKQVSSELEAYGKQNELLSVPSSISKRNSGNQDLSNIEKSLESLNISSEQLNIPRYQSYQTVYQSDKVFGNQLCDVIELSSKSLFNVKVPSILAECVNFLIDNDAIYEEGIFRLNGSSSLIKSLKAKYDEELSVDLNGLDQKPDINSIAGLLKLWFREISGDLISIDILNKLERRKDVNDIETLKEWKQVFMNEVHEVNKNVLFAVMKFLDLIVEQQEYNKMNLKNLSIVFSPTFNISNDVLVELLVNYEYLFNDGEIKTRAKEASVSNF